mmetsp:Transcript_9949/g.27208  ORF Transcript_9949/g.27208 Transcript_9949/m.27208 type:complete len:215 (-) Transcript_9949:406-1050(-)
MSTRVGIKSSSSSGMPEAIGSIAKCASSPMRPPTKILHPGTAIFFPSISFLAGPPMIPMSATWTCPQLFGHPVQWMRIGRSTVTRSSSFLERASAFPLVSINASPQNWAPVQDTTLPSMKPGDADMRDPLPSTGSASISLTLPSSTLGKIRFCSTVMRISPAEYLSARSARSRHSVWLRRPAGTWTPTRTLPSCFCGCTPNNSRRSNTSVSRGC